MERLEDRVREGVVLLDGGVVQDIATALTGDWQPDDEDDPARRDQMVAAARLRIFADRSQYGWALAATADAREKALGLPNASWTVGFIQDIATMDGAPPVDDVRALEKIFHEEEIVGDAATCLAYAVLFDAAAYVITQAPADLRHQRAHDRPRRLEIIDPIMAVERLALVSGESPVTGPPAGSRLDQGPHWWLP